VPSKALIIPAAGAGKRMQRNTPKPFIKLQGRTILEHTLQKFVEVDGLEQVIIATSTAYINEVTSVLAKAVPGSVSWDCIEGGAERQQSVFKALQKIADVDLVMIHDAVRPFIKKQHIYDCCKKASESGAAILGIPAKDTIKKVDANGVVVETPDRSSLWQVQTPQVFQTPLIKQAHAKAAEQNHPATDDASLVEWIGKPVHMVQGSVDNIKITYPRDLQQAKIIFGNQNF
jgi:2-C-methyl-D-erythritol 4-phosphate cytidylyltransferase